MSLQQSMDKVFQEIMAMSPEEFYIELNKPVENGIGDWLVDAGIDLCEFIKPHNKKNRDK